MNIELQQVAFMVVIVLLLFVLAHYVRKWSAPKVKTADDLEVEQLSESLYKMAEYTAWAEYYSTQAALHAKRAKRLQAKGVKLPEPIRISNGHQRPPMRPPAPPPNPTRAFGTPPHWREQTT